MGGRGQTKRLQSKVYKYLQEQGPMTSIELCDWYNSECYSDRFGYNYGTTPVSLGCILRASVLFEKIGERGKLGVWDARPLDVAVSRAIASRKPIKKFPMFLQEKIKERLDE
jgi:hypothetical protein|tara:strand:- start:22174 stop:22509 length:336 start_codon:yes stop_codon:yes gene_type:complete